MNEPRRFHSGRISTKAFVLWWIALFYAGLALPWVINELFEFLFRIFQIENFAFYVGKWYFDALQYVIIGVVIAMAQVWLMKKYRNITIPYWRIVTVTGWLIVGILLSVRVYDRPIIEKHLVMIGYFTMPVLLQTLPMALTMRRGWLWGIIGIIGGLLYIVVDWSYDLLKVGFILYLMTALAFHRLQPRRQQDPTVMKNTT